MGRWGFELFQGDAELDIIGEFADDLKVEDLYCPEKPAEVRDKLNDGRLTKKLDQIFEFTRIPPNELTVEQRASSAAFWGWKFGYVLLCAAAMCVGATISKDHMEKLAVIYKTAEIYPEGRQQVARALRKYPNDGTPYDMCGLGLTHQMDLDSAKEARSDTKWKSLRRCWWCRENENDEHKLLECAGCHIALYCKKDCQKDDWALHKSECKGETKVNAQGTKVFKQMAKHELPNPNQHHLTIIKFPR